MIKKLTPFAAPYLVALAMFGLISMPAFSQKNVGEERGAAARERSRERGEEFEGPGTVKARNEYFHSQRAYPMKHIPAGARMRAYDQLQEMRRVEAARTAKTPQDLYVWQVLGPNAVLSGGDPVLGGPRVTGRVTAIAIDPTTPATIYEGAAEGGVWKSINSGATWTPLTDNQPTLAVGSIAIDPTNDQIVYVGTGEENNNSDAYYGEGVLKSTDGGNTWTLLGGGAAGAFSVCSSGGGQTSGGAGSYIGSIAVNPANNQTILAAVNNCQGGGVYKSTDGGNTWAVIPALNTDAGTSVFWVNGTTAYASLSGGSVTGDGVYESTDGGNTWVAANGMGANVLPSGTAVGRIRMAASPSTPTTLYAALAAPGSGAFLGLYTTVDGGVDWTVLPNAPYICAAQCFYDMEVAVSPANANIVYVGGTYNYGTGQETTASGSTDGGATWTLLGAATDPKANGAGLHTDLHVISFVPDGKTVYVGTDGGVWSGGPTDTPANFDWTDRNAAVATAQFYPGFAFDAVDERHGVGGAQDNGTSLWLGSKTWYYTGACGDGGFNAVDSTTTPSTYYASCNYVNAPQISKTQTPMAYTPWTSIVTGINPMDPALFIPPLVMDPSTPSNLYFGTNQIYQTTNGGTSWASISPQPLSPNMGQVDAITVAPSSSTTVYAATNDGGVFVTTNAGAGATWTPINKGLPNRYPSHLTVDFKIPTTAYVTFSGFSGYNGDMQGHVFATTNGGTTWTDISGNLPNIPANDFVIDIHNPGIFYVATDLGVFYTLNGGTSWATLGTGLPNVAVLSLTEHPKGNVVIAATHGRGAWTINEGGQGPAGAPMAAHGK